MSSDLSQIIEEHGRRARAAVTALATASTEKKNAALQAGADQLENRYEKILEANRLDCEAAEQAKLSAATIDRLRLDKARISSMAQGVREIAKLLDPVGRFLREWERPNGLRIQKVSIPIGVIGIIYESRPNVTADAGALCLKAGNAVVLRGGSEARHTNSAISDALRAGCEAADLPADSIQLVAATDRSAVKLLAQLTSAIDLLIPRGGKSLIEAVSSVARVPVIKHYDGVCHVFVDEDADLAMAESIVLNAKCQRPGVCNAAEALLIHDQIAEEFLKRIGPELLRRGVELRGDAQTRKILGQAVRPATEEDWRTEYLDLILSVRVVEGLAQAIQHIDQYGSHHTDAIVTGSARAAEQFLDQVDSSVVLWNASTRFNDGGEFGFGAEIGISTDRLHARGPMGLEELTTFKYRVIGTGQIRE
jgi:glutamate-5-semialdehyde dehydrogenase